MGLLVATLLVLAFIAVGMAVVYGMVRFFCPNDEYTIITPAQRQAQKQAWRAQFEAQHQARKVLQAQLKLMEQHKKLQELEAYKQQHPELFNQ